MSLSMQKARDWTGIRGFPNATQNKLHELLEKLKYDVLSFHFLFSLIFLMAC